VRRLPHSLTRFLIDHASTFNTPAPTVARATAGWSYCMHESAHGRRKTHGVDLERQLQELPQVLECFSVSGESDYILRIVAENLESFSAFMMSRILSLPGVGIVKSHIALQKIKQTSEFPLQGK
jgi:DNA-binding Lrp family transcriptional regulator